MIYNIENSKPAFKCCNTHSHFTWSRLHWKSNLYNRYEYSHCNRNRRTFVGMFDV